MLKRFKNEGLFFNEVVKYFTEETAPDWLTSCNTVKGSTMDNRWFWEERVLALEVGESVQTDFSKITRLENV